MSTVHLVDDTESFRDALSEALKSAWRDAKRPESQWPDIREWDLVWNLTEALDNEEVVPEQGDIVVTDLYPAGYWKKVKRLGHRTTESRSDTLPGDPTNMYRAVTDIRRRFLPCLTQHGLKVIVLTYVPRHIEKIRPDQSPLSHKELVDVADKVRTMLRHEKNWRLIEKQNRRVTDRENVEEAVDVVNELLGEPRPA